MEHIISTLSTSINHLRASDHFKFIKHGDEGSGHWYELFESRDPEINCGGSCTNTAKFVLYTHYHNEEDDVTAVCEDHAPRLYLELFDKISAG